MESRLNKKIETYFSNYKNNIRDKATELDIVKDENVGKLLQYIYDYERLTLDKSDFVKRKRVKNTLCYFDRCCAKRMNNEQCTRRKKEGCNYCGTHLKGIPNGVVKEDDETEKNDSKKIEVWAHEIQGIIYYIDKLGNVYQAEDIVLNKDNPQKIAKYVKNGDKITIPSFGI